jgi:WD40 repeat protein
LYFSSGSTVVAWDTRQKGTEVINLGEVPVQSLSTNTGETNFLATGSENGTVAFWDLRNTELPLYKEQAHKKAVRRYLNLPV